MAKKSTTKTPTNNKTRENTLDEFKGSNVKKPSRKPSEEDLTLKSVTDSVLVSVCGLLSTLIGGQESGNKMMSAKSSTVLGNAKAIIGKAGAGLLGNTNNIKSIVKSIKEDIKTYNQKIYDATKTIAYASGDWLAFREKAFSNEQVLSLFSNVEKIFKQMTKEKNNDDNLDGSIDIDLTGDNTIVELLDKLQDQDFINRIPDIKALFDPTNDDGIVSLITALNHISELINSNDVTQSMQALGMFIQNIIQLSTIDPKLLENSKSNSQYIAEHITDYVVTIINSLKESATLTKENYDTYIALDAFFKTVMALGSHINKRTAFVNVLFIRYFLLHSVKVIIKSLSEAEKLTQDSMTTMSALYQFIVTIQNIGTIDAQGRKRINKNLSYITKKYIPKLKGLIQTFLNSIPEDDINQLESRNKKLSKVLGRSMTDINDSVEKQKPIKKGKLNALQGSLAGVSKLVLASGAVLILGGLFMKIIDKKDLMIFTATLAVFVIGVIAAITRPGAEEMQNAMEFAKATTWLVLSIGFTLILGSLIMESVDLGATMQFLFGYAVIMGVTVAGLAYLFKSKQMTDAAKTVSAIAILILAIGFTLALGSAIMDGIGIEGYLMFLFGYLFVMFVTVVGLRALKAIMDGAHTWKTIIAISVLILAIGFTLALGSLIMELVSMKAYLMFIIGYLVVMLITVAGLWALKQFMDGTKVWQTLLGISVLILAVGFTLALGSLIMEIVSVAAWGMFMGGYIVVLAATLGFLYALGQKKDLIIVSIEQAAGFAIIMLAAALTLSIGSMAMEIVSVAAWGMFMGGYIVVLAATLGFLYALGQKKDLIIVSLEQATGFAVIMLAVGLTMAIGGIAMNYVSVPALIKFIIGYAATMGILGLFLWGTSLIPGMIQMSIETAGAFAIIMLAVGLTMSLGSWAMKLVDWKQLGMFLAGYAGMMLVLGLFLWGISAFTPVAIATAYGIAVIMGSVVIGMTIIALAAKHIKIDKAEAFVKTYMSITADLFWGLTKIVILSATATIASLAAIAVYSSILVGAAALQQLSKTKINEKNALKFVKLTDKILTEVAKFARFALVLPPILESLVLLGDVITSIAEAVQNYSSLRIPVYEGKKVKEYRTLKDEDFKAAARNVSLIISTLGNAVIKTYEKNPKLFETNLFGNSPFGKVCRALNNLGPMISEIAEGVRDYAALAIVDEWMLNKDGRLVPKSKRHMDDNDFKSAVRNIQLILDTLGKSVIKAYEEHPEYYDSGIITNSPFTKVTKAFSNLGPMISEIAEGVRDYAALAIVDEWMLNKDGRLVPKSKRHMDDNDFQSATTNIQLILDTLGKSVITAYEEHPEYYDSGLFSNSPFTKVTKALGNLGPMISEIAEGVRDYAALNITDEWMLNKDGRLVPKNKRLMKDDDFKGAVSNIGLIINTLGTGIIAAYEQHPEYYEDGSDSIFANITKALSKLGTLVSGIANGIRDYAALSIVDEWVMKDGKLVPKNKRLLKKEDFTTASDNVQIILSTLGKAIIKFAKENPEFFGEDGDYGERFAKIIGSITKISDVVTGIANGVLKMAEGKIEVYDEKTGKPKGYEHLTTKHYDAAAESVKKIISTIGGALITTYEEHKEMFNVEDEDSPFSIVVTAVSGMGTMMSNLAKGIQQYADLKFPKYKEGSTEIDTYEDLSDGKVLASAATNIAMVTSTLASTIYYLYEGKIWNPETQTAEAIADINGDQLKKIFDGDDDSQFNIVVRAVTGMGEMIMNIAEGLQMYADLKFPIYKKGSTEIETYKDLDQDTFKDASANIGMTVGILGKTIMALYQGQVYDPIADTLVSHKTLTPELAKQMFAEFDYNNIHVDSPFARVVNGVMGLGEMIKNIAEGIAAYANNKYASKYNERGEPIEFVPLFDTDFTKAAQNISSVVGFLGEKLMATFGEHKEWFEVPNINVGPWGMFSQTPDTNAPTPFQAMVNGISSMGRMISNVANAIASFASLLIPVFDKKGNVISFEDLSGGKFDAAKNSISDILITIGIAMDTVYKQNPYLFNSGTAEKIGNSIATCGSAIEKVANAIKTYADLKFPVFDEKTKKFTGEYRKLEPTDIEDAKQHISDVLIAIGDSIAKFANSPFMRQNKDAITSVATLYEKIGKVLPDIAKAVETYANLKSPVYKDGKIVDYVSIKPEVLKEAKTNISELLKSIGTAICEVVTLNKDIFGDMDDFIENPQAAPVMLVAAAIAKMSDPVVKMAAVLKDYSGGDFKDEKGNRTTLTDTQLKGVGTNIFNVLDSIPDAFQKVKNSREEMFEEDMVNKMSTGMNSYTSIVVGLANSAKQMYDIFSTMKIDEYVTSLFTIVNSYVTAVNTLNGASEFAEISATNIAFTGANNISATASLYNTTAKSFSAPISNNVSTINAYVDAIKNVINVGETAKAAGSGGYDILSKGINTVNKSVKDVKSTGTFKQHQEVLDKYVKVVNSINTTKMNSLTLLTLSTTLLANKMGNLDKLTSAIANELANALTFLAKKLDEAKETINKTEEIQRKRHQAIKDSVENIKTIMGKKLSIEIHRVADTTAISSSITSSSSGSSTSSTQTASVAVSQATPQGIMAGGNTLGSNERSREVHTDDDWSKISQSELVSTKSSDVGQLGDAIQVLINHFNNHIHTIAKDSNGNLTGKTNGPTH